MPIRPLSTFPGSRFAAIRLILFTNVSSDDKYPGHMSKEPDQRAGECLFSLSVLEDTVDKFVIELRMVNQLQFIKESLSTTNGTNAAAGYRWCDTSQIAEV